MKTGDSEHTFRDLSVLFVDDEECISLSIVSVLKRRFGNVYLARDGQAGCDLFKKHQPDFVLTDILMPIMNGIEMIRCIREVSLDVPVIVMTALNEEPYLEETQKLNIQGYLLKPIDKVEFTELINNIAADLLKLKK
ncbi:MAG: response regulator [Nitrospirae bacterium]|nr:response regulator [Nitrospirota bacterium]